MIRRLRRGKVGKVAIERGDGPVVEALMDSGLTVYVVPPRQVKALRERYGSAGNKDDRFDAYLLADTLRSDGHRWRPLREDSDATKALRALCRSRKDLVEVRVGVVNQLRANLELAFPAESACSPGPTAQSRSASCVVSRPQRRRPGCRPSVWPAGCARSVTTVALAPTSCYSRLVAAAPGLTGSEGDARGQITCVLGDRRRGPQRADCRCRGPRSQICSRLTPISTSSRACQGRGR